MSRIQDLEDLVDSLVKGLHFYADPLCYMPPDDDTPPSIVVDQGEIARATLLAAGYPVAPEPPGA